MWRRIAVVLAFSFLVVSSALAREGFGFTKRSADMVVRNPPAVATSGTRFEVTARSERNRNEADARELRRYIEDAVIAGNAQMTPSTSADVVIAVDVDRLAYDQRSESKVENESKKTKDKDGKTQYVDVPKTKYYTVVDAELAGTFHINDGRGRSLDAGDIDKKFREEYEYSAPKREKITEDLLRGAARKIASRIVPVTEKVTVLIPKGSFEAYASLAESNSWDAYLRAVEAVPQNRDAAAEAYRQYALGVAKEGLAHSTPDKTKALELLRSAAAHYRTAVVSNPGEKLFSERYTSLLNAAQAPIARVETSIAAYDAWVNAAPATPAASASSSASSKSRPKSRSKTMSNETVEEMSRAGLTDDVIIAAIDAAASTSFDTSPDALIALSKNGVSSVVLRRMQHKAR
jgi:hypothetical protein